MIILPVFCHCASKIENIGLEEDKGRNQKHKKRNNELHDY